MLLTLLLAAAAPIAVANDDDDSSEVEIDTDDFDDIFEDEEAGKEIEMDEDDLDDDGEVDFDDTPLPTGPKDITAVFVNKFKETIVIVWVSPSTKAEQVMGQVKPADKLSMNSFPGQTFLVKLSVDDNEAAGSWTTTNDKEQMHVFTAQGKTVTTLAGDKVKVEISSRIDATAYLMWLHPDNGAEKHLHTVEAGKTITMNSFIGHELIVRSAPEKTGKLLVRHHCNEEPAQKVVIRKEGDDGTHDDDEADLEIDIDEDLDEHDEF